MEAIEITIGDIANLSVEQTGPAAGNDFIYVDISSINRHTKQIVDFKTLNYSEAPSRAKQVLKSGDVLISMTRPNLNAVSIVPDALNDAIGSTGFYVLRTSLANPKFLFYLVQTQAFVNQMCLYVQGALYPAVRPKDISSFKFLLPSYLAQNRIVAKLDELLSDLDAGIAALERAKANLKRYRASVLKAAVEGKLTAEWRRQNPSKETGAELLARILKERRAKWGENQLKKLAEQGKAPPKNWRDKYPEPSKPSYSISGLPDGWGLASIEQIASDKQYAITDGPFGSNLKTEHYTSQGPRVIRLQNIGNGFFIDERAHISETHFESLQKHSVESGDIVIAMLGEILPRASIVPDGVAPAVVKADCAKLSVNQNCVSNLFANAALNSECVIKIASRMVKGIGRPRLNLGHIKSLPIPVPSTEEQLEIESEISHRLSIADATEKTITHALTRAARLRQAILKRAFEGRLVPQDPNDEPASELLKRIQAERATQEAAPPRRTRKPKEVKAHGS